jgi:hypothetical protein
MIQQMFSRGKSPFQQSSRQAHRISLGLLALSMMATSLPAFAADLFPLQSIDFVSKDDVTKIYMHTGSIVPYRTVLVSDNKIVMDVDQVKAQDAIKTNFSNADNISHVVLQPLSNQTVRLIIRGEHLKAPSVAFLDLNAPSAQYSGFSRDEMALEGSEAPPEALRPAEAPAHRKDLFDQPASDTPETGLESSELSGEPTPLSEPQSTGGEEGFQPANLPVGTPIGETQDHAKPLTQQSEAKSNFFDQLPGGDWTPAISIAGVGLLLLGFGWFIKRKLSSLGQNRNDFGQAMDWADANRGKRNASFADLASTYQQTNPRGGAGKKGLSDGPIGLGGLKQFIEDDERMAPPPPPVYPQTAAPRSQAGSNLSDVMLPPLPAKKKAANPMPKQQAVSQYAQQASLPPQGAQKKRITDDVLRQEIQRSAEIKRQAEQITLPSVNRQKNVAAASVIRKTASTPPKNAGNLGVGGNPLPPNPEVLNFLRSVADLMEKDGRPMGSKPAPATKAAPPPQQRRR